MNSVPKACPNLSACSAGFNCDGWKAYLDSLPLIHSKRWLAQEWQCAKYFLSISHSHNSPSTASHMVDSLQKRVYTMAANVWILQEPHTKESLKEGSHSSLSPGTCSSALPSLRYYFSRAMALQVGPAFFSGRSRVLVGLFLILV